MRLTASPHPYILHQALLQPVLPVQEDQHQHQTYMHYNIIRLICTTTLSDLYALQHYQTYVHYNITRLICTTTLSDLYALQHYQTYMHYNIITYMHYNIIRLKCTTTLSDLYALQHYQTYNMHFTLLKLIVRVFSGYSGFLPFYIG